jgi:hypothetical protein
VNDGYADVIVFRERVSEIDRVTSIFLRRITGPAGP